MRKKIYGIIATVALLYLIGTVGACENGAISDSRMILTFFVCLAVMAAGMFGVDLELRRGR